MCTAISYKTNEHYFGRNFDLEYSYHETVTITPRNYKFVFQHAEDMKSHYAMIGVAYVVKEYPLYYDATNEKGLSVASLNFPQNAVYQDVCKDKDNIATFELIPWILAQCGSVTEAKELLKRTNLIKTSFSKELPATPLHYMIADSEECIVVEPMEDGLKLYENPVNVLTNNPPFPYHMTNLCNYAGLSNDVLKNTFSEKVSLTPYSRGMGAMGLPGDLSSASRFVKAAFTLSNSVVKEEEEDSITQFFHVLNSVCQQRGCVKMGENAYEVTIYSSCCNTKKGIYYYTTYENSQITAVDMHQENLDGNQLISYEMIHKQQIKFQNKKY